jgi:hypothetical protein
MQNAVRLKHSRIGAPAHRDRPQTDAWAAELPESLAAAALVEPEPVAATALVEPESVATAALVEPESVATAVVGSVAAATSEAPPEVLSALEVASETESSGVVPDALTELV